MGWHGLPGLFRGLAHSLEAVRGVTQNASIRLGMADEELVFRRFGTASVARWKEAERLYRAARPKARFALYPGAAHEVTDAMQKDVEAFFAEGVARP